MPIKKLCSKTGCSKVIDYNKSYCDKHQAEWEVKERERYREYSNRRRKDKEQKKHQDFYNSTPWKRLSESMRRKFNGMCVICLLRNNKIVNVEAVHHIKELSEEWGLRLNDENLICLCERCHRRVHMEYEKSIRDKEKMQRLLFALIEKYENEYSLGE